VLSADDMLVEIADAMAPDKPVLGQRLAVLAVSAWRSASSEAALVAWLDRLGVPDLGVVRRLHRVFGDVAMERIAANPYVMVPLLPWKRTDAIGKRLILEDGGDPAGDRRRIVGAADEAVKQMLRRGDTASSARDFGMETANLLALPLVADAAVTIAAETGAVLPAGDVLRAPGAAALEDDLAFRLRSVIAGADASRPAPRPASEWAEMLADLAGPGRALEDEQNAAVVRIMSLPLACLVGGAGVGKTFTCKMVCDLWVRLGGNVLLCALAGKAALRLSRSTGRLAKTVARSRRVRRRTSPSNGSSTFCPASARGFRPLRAKRP
jgi:exodeoxyribonuclease V alpha subunit